MWIPTVAELNPKEDNIKFDQYTKVFGHIGSVPDTEGKLMSMVEQVSVFEQNFLLTMKGVSPACEFYAKLLLNGTYDFLDQLQNIRHSN